MKQTRLIKMTIVTVLMSILLACNNERANDNAVSQEPGNTATVNNTTVNNTPANADAGTEAGESGITVGDTDHFENIAISDWIDDDTVVISKDNEALGKMSLNELADSYPKSLYLYHLNTKQYELLREQKDVYLGEASLSSDKQHLLYSEYALGDPVYHVMDLDSEASFVIKGDLIAGAMSAHWTDDGTVIGAAYSGGAFTANPSGEISPVAGLDGEALVIVRKMKDKLVYNTNADESLQALDLTTKEKASLNLPHVRGVIPAPDGQRMLVLQNNESKQTLILCDAGGGHQAVLAEGAEIGGVSWSPDQRLIAYNVRDNATGAENDGLYLYDLLSDKPTRIANDIANVTTAWSSSSRELAYTEWSDKTTSSIVHLTDSLQK